MAKAEKVYAVRVGRKPGVYSTWEDAKVQVNGFPGAIYKSFLKHDDLGVQAFMNPTDDIASYSSMSKQEILTKSKQIEELAESFSIEEGTYVLFTDGSHQRNDKGRSCYAHGFVVIKDEKVIHEGSGADNLKDYLCYENVAGELAAAMRGVHYIYKTCTNVRKIVLFHDYTGVSQWPRGNWKANNPMSRGYIEFMSKFRTFSKIHIEYFQVKGHSKNKYNDLADELAKRAGQSFLSLQAS